MFLFKHWLCLPQFSANNAQKVYWKYRKDLDLNLYFIDLKYEQNAENITRDFAEFFFTFGRFLATTDHLPIITIG